MLKPLENLPPKKTKNNFAKKRLKKGLQKMSRPDGAKNSH
jgi:hypothetical protein